MTEWHSNKYWQNRSKDERIKNLRIPARYRDKSLANYDKENGDEDAFDAVNLWCNAVVRNREEGMGLYLYGHTGVGKTHLAQGVALHAITNNTLSGIFVTADRYIEMVYDEMRNDGDLPEPYSDPFLLKYMRRTFDILVLDGLGSERATTEFARNALISLVDNRYEERLITIVTSVLPPNELSRVYGKRLMSILQESCYLINVEGPDYRKVISSAGE
jgi:DNA replication protein DnaC